MIVDDSDSPLILICTMIASNINILLIADSVGRLFILVVLIWSPNDDIHITAQQHNI
jgi:hypothetical protein